MRVVDTYMAYQFVKRLVQPFEKWPAYKYGIIDGDGNILRKRSSLTGAEADTFGVFDLTVLNIKRLLPKGSLSSIAAAVYLVKEGEENVGEAMEAAATLMESQLLIDDAPTNSAGSGQVAGLGVPAGSLPAAPKVPARKRKRRSLWR